MKLKAIVAMAMFGLTLEFRSCAQVLWDFSGNWVIEFVGESNPAAGPFGLPSLVINDVSENTATGEIQGKGPDGASFLGITQGSSITFSDPDLYDLSGKRELLGATMTGTIASDGTISGFWSTRKGSGFGPFFVQFGTALGQARLIQPINVPEPSSYTLAGLGLFALVLFRRNRG